MKAYFNRKTLVMVIINEVLIFRMVTILRATSKTKTRKLGGGMSPMEDSDEAILAKILKEQPGFGKREDFKEFEFTVETLGSELEKLLGDVTEEEFKAEIELINSPETNPEDKPEIDPETIEEEAKTEVLAEN